MADKHPYVTSSGPLIQVLNHLRSAFPATVTAETIKKLGYAPKNESYIISTLRFLGLIDKEGNKTDPAKKTFSLHQDKDFSQSFEALIKEAYNGLFALYDDRTWTLDAGQLITFFRQNDQSSAIVGQRQAHTFIALAGLAGHRDITEVRTPPKANNDSRQRKGVSASKPPARMGKSGGGLVGTGAKNRDVGLTVRIELNLPAEGTQETYDRIFRSIKENLLNG